jgi:hypothetical protein
MAESKPLPFPLRSIFRLRRKNRPQQLRPNLRTRLQPSPHKKCRLRSREHRPSPNRCGRFVSQSAAQPLP